MKHWFTQEASILSRTTSTGWGGETAWTTSALAGPVMGRMNPVSGVEHMSGDKRTLFADHKFYCSATEAIDETDRLKWNGDTYEVVFVKDTLGLGHHKTVYVKEPV